MAASQQRNRKQIRQSVGLLTGKLWQDAGVESSPSEAAPSAGKLIDQNLAFGAEDDHRGKWLWATDSNSSTYQRRVIKSSPSERSVDLSVTLPRAPDTAWTFELWEPEVSPTVIHEFINQSITEATRKGAVPLTSDSFHTGGNVRSWGLSSDVAGIRFVQWRRSFTGQQITSLDNAMTAGANSSVVTDSGDKREGSAANRITIADAASSFEQVATDSFSAINIRPYTNVAFWAKSNVTTTSSNLAIVLQDAGLNLKIFGLPALNSDSWTRVDFALNTPSTTIGAPDTAITRFGFRTGSSDGGSATVLVDDVVTYRQRAEEWVTIPRDFWGVDKDRRELVFSADAQVPYAKVQITGVRKPALLNNDTTIAEIDPDYIVNATAAKVFRLLGEMGLSDRHAAEAERQRLRMTTPSGIKWVDE